MSNLLEICWQYLMSWLKNKQINLQSFKTSTVLNEDVCWLLFLSLSSGQLWQQNALKNIQPMLEKDQKQIRCQLQLMPVVQERGKNKVRRWFFLAVHHSVFLICNKGSWAQHSISAGRPGPAAWLGLCCPALPHPCPQRTDQPLFWQHQDFPPSAPPHWAGSPGEGKNPGCWFDLTSNSESVQGGGSPAQCRQWLPSQGLALSGSGTCSSLDLWAVPDHGTISFPALATLRPIFPVCICKITHTVLG